jgi:hypothetical protein
VSRICVLYKFLYCSIHTVFSVRYDFTSRWLVTDSNSVLSLDCCRLAIISQSTTHLMTATPLFCPRHVRLLEAGLYLRRGEVLTKFQCSKLLLAFISTKSFLILGYIFLSRLLHVLKWGPLFDERRGPTTSGHSPALASDSWSVGRSVKVLLTFANTVIPGFSLLEIHDQVFYSLLDMYVFRNGAFSSTKGGGVGYVSCIAVLPWVIRAVTAPKSLWTLYILCHCTVLSNIYTKYTEVSCQCRLMQQVMA